MLKVRELGLAAGCALGLERGRVFPGTCTPLSCALANATYGHAHVGASGSATQHQPCSG